MKFLRGSIFDIFGNISDSKNERLLVDDYIYTLRFIVENYNKIDINILLELSNLPQIVRGYGHVKEKNLELYYSKKQDIFGNIV